MDTRQTTVTAPRGRWAVALLTHPPHTIVALAEELGQGWQVVPTAIPQAGLTMLRLRESVYGEDYYLGELPFASAAIEVVGEDGRRYAGAAQAMVDAADLVLALAFCDALLANALPGHERVAALIEEGMRRLAERERARMIALLKTRVNFSELNSNASDNNEA